MRRDALWLTLLVMVCQEYSPCASTPEEGWTKWSAWSSCRSENMQQTRSRACQTSCSGSDWEARYCDCDEFLPETCEEDPMIQNAVGYLPDPCDEDCFYHCQKTDENWMAWRINCPKCMTWSQDDLVCVDANITHPDCIRKENGTEYIETIVVFENETCLHDTQLFRLDVSSIIQYLWLVNGDWWVQHCSLGTIFSMTKCQCIVDNTFCEPNPCQNGGTCVIREHIRDCICAEDYHGIFCQNRVLKPNTATACLTFNDADVWSGVYVSHPGVPFGIFPGITDTPGASFDGIHHMEIPLFAHAYDRFHKFSISFWFNRTDNYVGNQCLISNGGCGDNPTLQIIETMGKLNGLLKTKHGQVIFLDLYAAMGQWHHVVLSYDGAFMSLYVDRFLSYRTPLTGKIANSVCPLSIGFHGTGAGHFIGDIDELYIYDSPLTPEQVRYLYENEAMAECQLY